MAYVKSIWEDRVVEYPNRYKDQNGNVYTFTRYPGEVTSQGTIPTKEKMDNIENGIEQNDNDIGNLEELNTTEKGNLVGAINEVNNSILKRNIVYENSSGGSDTSLTLNKSVSNAKYIEIFYGRKGTSYPTSSMKFLKNTDNKFYCRLSLVYGYDSSNMAIVCATAIVDGTSLTYESARSVVKDIVVNSITATQNIMDLAIFEIVAYE